MKQRRIIFLGDTHGEWDTVFRVLDGHEIQDVLLIHVGDIGVGFVSPEKQKRQFDILNDRFKKRKINFVGIKGNHDDPKYFDGSVCMSNFELLPDYTKREINGEKFLFIGGAVSVDRLRRTPEVSWWSGEEIVFKPELIDKCDVLVTHSAPIWNGPNDKAGISGWCDRDPTLWDDCSRERRVMNEIIRLSQPTSHFCGHFHCQSIAVNDGCYSRILDIHELYEYKPFS